MEKQDQQRPKLGMEVVDNADYLMGTVEQVEPDHFVVQKGFFFPKSHRIGMGAIQEIRGKEVTLRISREQAIHASEDTNWSDRPDHGEISPQVDERDRSAAEDNKESP